MGRMNPLWNTGNNFKEIMCVRRFRVFIEHHYGGDSFFRGDHTLDIFAQSSLCVWSQMPWRNLQTRVSP